MKSTKRSLSREKTIKVKVVQHRKISIRVILFCLPLLLSSGCITGIHYFIDNDTHQKKSVDVYYISNTANLEEVYTPPDSLRITTQMDLLYKPYKWYSNIEQKTPYHKINDTLYHFELLPNEKVLIPFRYYHTNSLQQIVINKKEEISFMEKDVADSTIYFEASNIKPTTSVNYKSGIFVGENYYLIEIR